MRLSTVKLLGLVAAALLCTRGSSQSCPEELLSAQKEIEALKSELALSKEHVHFPQIYARFSRMASSGVSFFGEGISDLHMVLTSCFNDYLTPIYAAAVQEAS